MSGNNYNAGRWAEKYIMDLLNNIFKNRRVKRITVYDSNKNEIAQTISINGNTFICPDIYASWNMEDEVIEEFRVEVKSFVEFPDNIPFRSNVPILIISKRQFEEYSELQYLEEVPIYIAFVINKHFPKLYWASIDNIKKMKRKEAIYTWKMSENTEVCYFFRADSFSDDIQEFMYL